MPKVTRERLLHFLAEASELEHNLLCSYLFALFSLKRRIDEDLSPEEHEAVLRWRKTLLSVCVEEMVHLTQVANLTSALGAVPHFNRPNFPVAPGYHPSDIVIALTPFNEETLKHFVFLERPDSVALQDAKAFHEEAAEPGGARPQGDAPLTPAAPEYATVGEFYELLKQSLVDFVNEKGDGAFTDESYQLPGELIDSEALLVVRNIKDAVLAIDRIVEQGEGASTHRDESHYLRFSSMLEELTRMQRDRPAFKPARSIGANPVMRTPQAAERTHVIAKDAVACLDAFNAIYWMMLRTLSALYAAGSKEGLADALVEHMLGCMHLLSDIADPLTEQRANVEARGMAGPSFTMPRHTEGAASASLAVGQLLERCAEIESSLAGLPIQRAALGSMQAKLARMVKKLQSAARHL